MNGRQCLVLLLLLASRAMAQADDETETFPAEPVLFADEPLRSCEGISFNGEGRLFATCNMGLWEIGIDGSARQLTDLYSNLGVAAYGDRDLLVADFGPTNAFRNGRNSDGKPVRDAKLVVRTGPNGAPDGLGLDAEGRVYIAANREGKIWRFDPSSDEMLLIAEGMFGCASLAFGQAAFDRYSIFVTTTYSEGRGGKIWRVPVGVMGAHMHR